MITEERPAILLHHLLSVKGPTMNQLVVETKLTKRQISYDLEKINHWLKQHHMPPIQYKRVQMITVPPDSEEYIRKQQQQQLQNESQFVLTEKERMIAIYLFLFVRQESISLAHLIQLLQVSKSTVISDVKKANELLTPFVVKIDYTRHRGYHLKGTEFDKRVVVLEYVTQLLQKPYGEASIQYILKMAERENRLDQIDHTLATIKQECDVQFVEERLTQFSSFLLFYYYRQQEKKFVRFHSDEIAVLAQDPMRKVTERMMRLLEIEIVEEEVCYLIVQLLGLSLGNLSVQHDLLFKICERLVSDFETKACIMFEQKSDVIQTLYRHVKPAYFRMKYRIPISNPLLQEIKNEHKELYMIVEELLLPLESLLNITISEEEIGFITIHFGALLEKPKRMTPKKKRAIVVCPSGVSSSLMVKNQLDSLFSEVNVERTMSLHEFQNETLEDDVLIFSTVFLQTNALYFHVKPIMTPTEKSRLVNEVYQHLFGISHYNLSVPELIKVIKKHADVFDERGLKEALSKWTVHQKVDDSNRRKRPVLKELLTKETIQIVDEITDWEEAIQVAATPLMNNKAIESSYIEAMIHTIKTLGPYVIIGPEIAIPHARPENGVNQIGMSFLKLNKPVHFLGNDEHPVRLIICVAAIDNKTHLTALSQLTKLLSKKEHLQQLKEVNQVDEVIQLVDEYSALSTN